MKYHVISYKGEMKEEGRRDERKKELCEWFYSPGQKCKELNDIVWRPQVKPTYKGVYRVAMAESDDRLSCPLATLMITLMVSFPAETVEQPS